MYHDNLNFELTETGYAQAQPFGLIFPTCCGMGRYSKPLIPGKSDEQALLLILSGMGAAEHMQTSCDYFPGCILLGKDASRFTLYPQEETCCLMVLMKHANALFDLVMKESFVYALDPGSRVCRLIERLCFRAQNHQMGRIELSSAECYAIMMELCVCTDDQPDQPGTLVLSALELMRRQYAYLSGMDELAEQLGVTKSHLIRTFTKEMKISPGKYLTKLRLEQAKLLLENREYTSELIAGMVGFADANYFAKVFRKAFDLSPGQYRQTLPPQPVLDAHTKDRLEQIEGRVHLE